MKTPLFFLLQLVFLLFLGCSTQLEAQENLVRNPSFEDTLHCPFGEFDSLADWINPTTASPDAFNSCSSGNFNVPNNAYGNRSAKGGAGYIGITSNVGGNNYREYIQIKLSSSLQANKKYYIKFFVCLTDSASYAVNDIGAYFSNTPIFSSSGGVLPYLPQAKNDPVLNPLNQRNIWQSVTDSFIANGGEQYITIGNFKDDNNVDTSSVSGGTNWATGYYYIDSVFVGLSNILEVVDEKGQFDNSLQVFPNPTSNVLTIVSTAGNINNVLLVDGLGNILLNRDHDMSGIKKEITLDVSTIAKGVYYLKIYSNNTYAIQKLTLN